MSTQLLPEQLYYVHCNFCNTILAVNVPGNNIFNVVTVRCGHCGNLLSVDTGGLLQAITLRDQQKIQCCINKSEELHVHNLGSIDSECSRPSEVNAAENSQQRMLPNRPPEKRARVPSAYNNFIKEEIQRIKANNPEISHRRAFSAAAKNWAHFPRIDFGLTLDHSNKPLKCDEAIPAQKSNGHSAG